jgi:hypothetical protein
LTQDEALAKMHFDATFFLDCVPRSVLAPSKLHWRVRAVYETCGNLIDSETGKPLFNETAWKKANNVLAATLRGEASDPPGFVPHHPKLDRNGHQLTNRLGFPLLECHRGTNHTECVHKQMTSLFRGWSAGLEISESLLAEFRHRHNQHVSERRRHRFPKLGHYDTWLVDKLQLLFEKNHGIALFVGWINASDYVKTRESFGTVPLHSAALGERINKIELPDDLKVSRDLRFLAEKQGLKCGTLPVFGPLENRLFARLEIEREVVDDDEMALDWCEHVDGKNIHPKLPVYLRTYRERFKKNRRVEDAVKRIKLPLESMAALNEETAAAMAASLILAAVPTDGIAFAKPAHPQEPQLAHVGNTRIRPVIQKDSRRSLVHKPRGSDKKARAPRQCQSSFVTSGGKEIRCKRTKAGCPGATGRRSSCIFINPTTLPCLLQFN